MVFTCAVKDCRSHTGKLHNLDKYPWMKDVRFFGFPPKDKSRILDMLREKWIKAMKKERGWEPQNRTRVCSFHFIDGMPSPEHPVPDIFPWGQVIPYLHDVKREERYRKRLIQETQDEHSIKKDAPTTTKLYQIQTGKKELDTGTTDKDKTVNTYQIHSEPLNVKGKELKQGLQEGELKQAEPEQPRVVEDRYIQVDGVVQLRPSVPATAAAGSTDPNSSNYSTDVGEPGDESKMSDDFNTLESLLRSKDRISKVFKPERPCVVFVKQANCKVLSMIINPPENGYIQESIGGIKILLLLAASQREGLSNPALKAARSSMTQGGPSTEENVIENTGSIPSTVGLEAGRSLLAGRPAMPLSNQDGFSHVSATQSKQNSSDNGGTSAPKQVSLLRNLDDTVGNKSTGMMESGRSSKIYQGFLCTVCKRNFDLVADLDNHMKREHGSGQKLKCGICGDSFPNIGAMTIHMRIHMMSKISRGSRFPCPLCDKSFIRRLHLEIHLERHYVQSTIIQKMRIPRQPQATDEEVPSAQWLEKLITPTQRLLLEAKFPCHFCGKVFALHDELRRHLRAHNDRRVVCLCCKNVFPSKISFGKHPCQSGKGPEETVLQCEFCGKIFKRPSVLRNHIYTHTKETRFSCEICGKGFIRKTQLKRHESIHTGKKEFVCSVCGRTFRTKANLQFHEGLHHNRDKTEICPNCGKAFMRKQYLRYHLQRCNGKASKKVDGVKSKLKPYRKAENKKTSSKTTKNKEVETKKVPENEGAEDVESSNKDTVNEVEEEMETSNSDTEIEGVEGTETSNIDSENEEVEDEETSSE